MSKLIRDYMKANKIDYRAYLFGKSVHNSSYVSKMNKEIGMPGSISEFRHMKASEIKYASEEERVLLSYKMRHSPFTNLQYVRKLEDDDDEPDDLEEEDADEFGDEAE